MTDGLAGAIAGGPAGYVIIALERPLFADDSEWAWDHLSRFHGWSDAEVAEERRQGTTDRHFLEHAALEGAVSEIRVLARCNLHQDGFVEPQLAIPHTHDRGVELAIGRSRALSDDIKVAALTLLGPFLENPQDQPCL